MPNDRTPSHPKGPYFFQKRTEGPVNITITEDQISDLDHYTDADFDARLALKSTTDLTEGSNLYFTNARADARIALATLADLSTASASDIDSGTLADARLSANVPLLDVNNVFSISQTIRASAGNANLVIDGAAKFLIFQKNEKNRWFFQVTDDDDDGDQDGGVLSLFARNDDGTQRFEPIIIPRDTGIADFPEGVSFGGGQTIADSDNVPLLDAENTFTGGPQTIRVVGGEPRLVLDRDAVGNRTLQYATNGSRRWQLIANASAETGSNAGSDFHIQRFTDAAAFIDAPFQISRATGEIAITNPLTVSGSTALFIDGTIGSFKKFRYLSGGTARWDFQIRPDDNDGDNDGGSFVLAAFKDDGSFLHTLFEIKRLPTTSDFSFINGAVRIGGSVGTSATAAVGFYNTSPIVKQTSVAVSAAGIHAALVNLGLISGP